MNENQSTENFDPTLNKILKFKESLKSADAKNNTFLSIDSAVWYIEALLNYNYCVIKDSSEIYPNTKMDSTFTEININNNKISFSDVARTYFQIEKTILTGLDNLNSENKRVSIVDVEYKNDELTAYYSYNFGNSGKNMWNITDDWHWAMDLGKCSDTLLDRDLTDQIRKWIHYHRGILISVYWTDLHISDDYFSDKSSSTQPMPDPFPQYNIDLTPYGVDMFCVLYPYPPPYPSWKWFYCVPAAWGNYYAQETNEAINVIVDNYLPPGYYYYSINSLWGFPVAAQMYDYTYIVHILKIWYGKPHTIPPAY